MMEPSAPAPRRNGLTWHTALLVGLLILSGLALTGYFGLRVLQTAQELHHMRLHPGETDVQLIREWMTVPYIARAYRVPESQLWQGLGIPEPGNRQKSLRLLDRQYAGGQRGVIIAKVREIILAYQAQHTPTPPAS